MGVPKRKVSKAHYRTRRMANRLRAPQVGRCTNCGEACAPHRVCPHCGWYKGRQVLTVELKK